MVPATRKSFDSFLKVTEILVQEDDIGEKDDWGEMVEQEGRRSSSRISSRSSGSSGSSLPSRVPSEAESLKGGREEGLGRVEAGREDGGRPRMEPARIRGGKR